MDKKLFFLVLLLSTAIIGANQSHGTQMWAKTYSGGEARCIQQTADGGYIVAGLTTSLDACVLKLDSLGNVEWQNTYGDDMQNEAYSIQQTADGGYIVGCFSGSFSKKMWIIKLDSAGDVSWQRTYGGAIYSNYVRQTSDGGYVVAGSYDYGLSRHYDFWVLKLDSIGNVGPSYPGTWQKTYGGDSIEIPYAIRQTQDGGYIVAGRTETFTTNHEDKFWVVKLDSGGSVTWQKAYGSGSDYESAFSVQQTIDEFDNPTGYIVAGGTSSFGAGERDVWVLKLDNDGSVSWQKTYGGSNYEGADCIQQTFDQFDNPTGYILTGYAYSFDGGNRGLWVLQLDTDGDVSWQKIYGSTFKADGNSIEQTNDGGYIVAGYAEPNGSSLHDIFVLKLDSNGEIPGCGIIDTTNAVVGNTTVTDENTGGATLLTSTTTDTTDIAAQSASADITVVCAGEGPPEPLIISIVDVGNDQGRYVRMQFLRSSRDITGSSTPIVQYEAYRRVDSLPPPPLVPEGATGTLDPETRLRLAREAGMLSDPVILLSGWDYAGAIPAHGEAEYYMIAPTLADSTVTSGMHWSVFFIRAATAEPTTFFDSPVDSGYSLDNLTPSIPEGFSVAYNAPGGNRLAWDPSEDADFWYFNVYRSTDPGFIPAPENNVHSTTTVEWVDPVAQGYQYHYKITAVDFSGNESDPGPPDITTGTGGEPAIPAAYVLNQNVPNPFNPMTLIHFGVPEGGGDVKLKIYDVGGRLVKTLVDGPQTEGWKSVAWDATDTNGRRVVSGVYFYRMTGPGFDKTKKMVLLR